jgi:hypothetical protein
LGNQRQYRVFVICRIIGKVDSGIELSEQSTREYRRNQMRGLQSIAGTSHASRFDGLELAGTVLTGWKTAKAAARGTSRAPLCVLQRVVASLGIGLPNLNQGIGHRQALAVEDPARQSHPLALGFGTGYALDAPVIRTYIKVEKGPRCL